MLSPSPCQARNDHDGAAAMSPLHARGGLPEQRALKQNLGQAVEEAALHGAAVGGDNGGKGVSGVVVVGKEAARILGGEVGIGSSIGYVLKGLDLDAGSGTVIPEL